MCKRIFVDFFKKEETGNDIKPSQNFDHSEFTKTAWNKLYQKTQNTTPSYG